MLAPDICNFKPSQPHQIYWQSTLNSDSLDNLVQKHSFNHSVSALFPDTLNLPPDILNCLNVDTVYYKISNLPVSEFVDYLFIEAFINRGELTALSIDNLLDIDNCAAITPFGLLVLSLNKDLFQELGIDKGPAVDLVKCSEKKHLLINLKETRFKPGKKNYDRIWNRLRKTKHLTMNFVLAWEPNEDKVCPSSIAAYFHKKGYLIEECIPSRSNRVDYNVRIPLDSTDPVELFEWFGLQALGFKEYSDPAHQEFLSSYVGTDDMDTVGQAVFIQWIGLFPTRKVQKFLNALRKYINEVPSIPFIGMHVQGFDDSPLSWGSSS
ncbi:hypothetical protein O3M35_005087 [Rhynocoris fuscipes]|uniref:Uncharacterized protein n=1 Tax=Rhynocoris fuscipes TaxID=488301 RepID=A0AAW1DKP9_9HEMI